MRLIIGALFFAVPTLFIATSCSPSGGTPPPSDAGPEREDAPAFPSCDDSSDCGGGEVCRDDECRESCSDAADCDDDFYGECEPELSLCVRCHEDAHCLLSERCTDNLCEPKCESDAECSGGFSCLDGTCTNIDPIVCVADEDGCDGTSVVRCNSDGTVEDRVACDMGETCRVGSDGPECAEQVCTPNEIGCLNADSAFLCSADGASQEELPCRSDQNCSEGSCVNQLCTPNEVSCLGASLLTCNANGTEATASSCDDDCTAPAGCGCSAGACVDRVCDPGAAQCVGNSRRTCDAVGSAWSSLSSCADICVEGACLSSSCSSGATSCSADTQLTCNASGTGYDSVDCTSDEEICVEDGQGGDCAPRVCTPNAVRCNGPGTGLRVCDASGSFEASVGCEGGTVCESGQCVPDTCVKECGARTCGPDPVCGQSCGSCAGTCTDAGVCELPQVEGVTVSVSWSPSTVDLDLQLARGTGSFCTTDACYWGTCAADPRPDWDGSGSASAGDPLLSYGGGGVTGPGPESITLSTPTAGTYRVGVHHYGPLTGASAEATVTIEAGGSVVATYVRTLSPGDLWAGVSMTLDGTWSAADISNVVPDYTCGTPQGGGDACTLDSQCPDGEYCVGGVPIILDGSCQPGCASNAECSSMQVCNGAHECVSATSLGDGGATCGDDADCIVGLECMFLSNVCYEPCFGTGSCAGQADCCPLTQAPYCSAGFVPGLDVCSDTP